MISLPQYLVEFLTGFYIKKPYACFRITRFASLETIAIRLRKNRNTPQLARLKLLKNSFFLALFFQYRRQYAFT